MEFKNIPLKVLIDSGNIYPLFKSLNDYKTLLNLDKSDYPDIDCPDIDCRNVDCLNCPFNEYNKDILFNLCKPFKVGDKITGKSILGSDITDNGEKFCIISSIHYNSIGEITINDLYVCNIKDLFFYELEQPELNHKKSYNMWYKIKDSNYYAYCHENGKYGFNKGVWFSNDNKAILDDKWELASLKDVEKLLLKYANDHYPPKTQCKCAKSGVHGTVSYQLQIQDALKVTGGFGYIFYEGKWAEIIKIPDKVESDFVLPKKWCIKSPSLEYDSMINKFARDSGGIHWSNKENYARSHYLNINKGCYDKGTTCKNSSFKEITIDQFKKYVLNLNDDIITNKYELDDSWIGENKYFSFDYGELHYRLGKLIYVNGEYLILNNDHSNNDYHLDKSYFKYSLVFRSIEQMNRLVSNVKELKFISTLIDCCEYIINPRDERLDTVVQPSIKKNPYLLSINQEEFNINYQKEIVYSKNKFNLKINYE